MAEDPSRHSQHPAAGPGGRSFRRLAVREGDGFWSRGRSGALRHQRGARAELGNDEHRFGECGHWTGRRPGPAGHGTFVLYREGQRRVTRLCLRLAPDYPLGEGLFQTVVQMKQTHPSVAGLAPVIELNARNGVWDLVNAWRSLWTAPARVDVWTWLTFDVTYSQDPSRGSVALTVQPHGGDPVSSQTFRTATLLRECEGGDLEANGIAPGSSIPSHLRVGTYHHSDLPGTHVDCAEVTVRAAPAVRRS